MLSSLLSLDDNFDIAESGNAWLATGRKKKKPFISSDFFLECQHREHRIKLNEILTYLQRQACERNFNLNAKIYSKPKIFIMTESSS